MKRNKSSKEDFEIKFWKDWLNANSINRLKMVNKLSIVRNLNNKKGMPKNVIKDFFAMQLNSFFEDLESAVYTKIRIENK